MFNKIIYKDKYHELMQIFQHIVEDKVPYAYKRTNYIGWTKLLHKLEQPRCKILECGNMGYDMSAKIFVMDDKQIKVYFNITDDYEENKYIDKYYAIAMNVMNDKTTTKFIEIQPYYYLDYEDWISFSNGCDFAWYKNHFIILTRDDYTCGGLFTLFVFGENAEAVMADFIGEEDINFTNTSLLQDIRNIYLEEKFKKQDNNELLKEIDNAFQNAVKANNYDLFKDYVADTVIYTNTSLYGYEDISGIKQIFNKIVDCKKIILMESFYIKNEITIHVKRLNNDDRKQNMVLVMEVNNNRKVFCASEIDPPLYNIPYYDK